MDKKEEINAINIQLIVIIISVASAIISVLLTYNQKLDLENKDTLLNPKNSLKLTYFNRILIVIISLVFLYINYKLYKISKNENENLESYIYQIIASLLTVIASVIALYVVTLSNKQDVADVENPII